MKTIHAVILSVCLGSLLYGYHSAAQTNEWEALIFESNRAYKEGRFQDAVDGYNKLIRMGRANGHIYYNLGNAYLKSGRLGYAILNYERARFFIPRDADLNYNLAYAHDQTRDVVSKNQNFIDETFFWLNTLTLTEIFWCLAFTNVVFCLSLLMHFVGRSEWIYYIVLTLSAGWLITGASFGLKWYQLETDNRAVIVADEIHVFSGPTIHDTALFKLHAGTQVHHERSEMKWHLIYLSDQKRGWVQANALEKIAMQSP